MSFFSSLRAKVLLSVLFTGAVILAAVGVTALFGYEQVAQGVVEQRDTELVRVSAARLAEGLTRHTRILQDTAADSDIQALNPEQADEALGKHLQDLVAFDAGVVVYDANGEAISADTYAEDLVGTPLPVAGVLEEVRDSQRPAFSDIFTSPISGDEVILMAVPIVGIDNEFQGVLVGMLNIHTSLVSATFAELLEFKAGSSGFAYLVDGTGKVIYHRNSTQIARDLSGIAPVSATIEGKTGAFKSEDPDGTTVISGFAPVPGTSWGIVTQEAWEVVAEPIQNNNELTLALLIIGGLLASGIIVFEIGLIFRPINDLTQGAQRIAGGDFNYKINPGTGDELDELAQQFNLMADNLRQSYSQLEQRVADRTRELRESEERLRTVVTSAPIILFLIDRDGTFTFSEGRGMETLGMEAGAWVGMSVFNMPEEAPEILDNFRRAFAGEPFTTTTETHDITFEIRYSPYLNDAGEIEGVIGVAIDVTERKRAEEALRDSEQRLRTVVNGAPVILAALDREGVFTLVEGQNLGSLTENPEGVVGRSSFDVLENHEDLRRALAGEAFTSTIEIGDYIFEARYSPQFDENGELVEVIGVATDVTERRRAEEALMESEEEAHRLARENSTMAEIGRIISQSPDINDVYNRFAELVKQLIAFDNIAVTMADVEKGTFVVAYSSGYDVPTRPVGQPVPLRGSATEEVILNKRGLLLNFEDEEDLAARYPGLVPLTEAGLKSYLGVPLISQGEPIGALHVLSENTNAYKEEDVVLLDRVASQIAGAIANAQLYQERVKAEEALTIQAEDLRRSNADLEQFAYVASHDLQEPLRAIVGFTKMLARRYEGKLGDDADNFIARTVNASMRMQELITDLLTYSRVGRNIEKLESTDCERILNNTLENLRASIEESGAKVTHDHMPTIMANNSMIGQVFSNLVSNAIKYRNDPSPHVHVSAERRPAEWLFSVRDNGIGIDPQFAERVFVIFQRLHGRTEYSGTGIGLAICKKAVERLGGRIWIESQPGEGSTFFFTIPVPDDESAVVGTSGSSVNENRSAMGG